jgi:hypothetical protein
MSIADLFAGTLAALILAALVKWTRSAVTKRKQVESARRALRPEVEHNLRQLAAFWEKVRPRKDVDEIHRVDKVVYAREFALAELPHFAREVYDTQLPLLRAYVRPEQLNRLAALYAGLAQIEGAHTELRAKRKRDIPTGQTLVAQPASSAQVSLTYDEFLDAAPFAWQQVQYTVETLLSAGNPLGRSA